MTIRFIVPFVAAAALMPSASPTATDPPHGAHLYTIVDTSQRRCYDDRQEIACPDPDAPFYGQDAQYAGAQPAYRDNGDGTVTDLVTGLTWTRALGEKLTWDEAVETADTLVFAGHDDWRLPTIKELYSLIRFDGGFHMTAERSTPYIDTAFFDFEYGDESRGERPIDVQVWSSTRYLGTTMGGNPTVFGVNFADGRIKGYPRTVRRREGTIEHRMLARYVRGNLSYGINDFDGGGDGTVLDRATGLVWQQDDAGTTHDWAGALAYCEALDLAGRTDWRLPNAKELQSIVDYTRAPIQTHSAALDPLFRTSDIESYYWTSTTHLDGPIDRMGEAAVYVAFGRAMGYLEMPPHSGRRTFVDVHGAGAQRSDPKSGDARAFPFGRGPQGDDIRIQNAVRCVAG